MLYSTVVCIWYRSWRVSYYTLERRCYWDYLSQNPVSWAQLGLTYLVSCTLIISRGISGQQGMICLETLSGLSSLFDKHVLAEYILDLPRRSTWDHLCSVKCNVQYLRQTLEHCGFVFLPSLLFVLIFLSLSFPPSGKKSTQQFPPQLTVYHNDISAV